jgi:hypothetical protein
MKNNAAHYGRSAAPWLVALVAAGGIAAPAVAVADPDLPYGPDTCKQGFVWREVTPADHICVTPQVRDQTAQENQLADQRRTDRPADPPLADYICLQGFVWREAFPGDWVCVPPASRAQAASDNAAADSRWVAPHPPPNIH